MLIKGKTAFFESPPVITGSAGVAGIKEGEGPLGKDFDAVYEDTVLGQESFELAESVMLGDAIVRAMASAGKKEKDINFILSGDLLDQCMGSSLAVKELNIASIGMYGACSTMALTMSTGAMLVDAGADCVACATSSHFCSSERQFRFPLEYGGQRPPTSQWTVTGAGAAVLEKAGVGVKIKAVHIGTITDLGVTDANNMGAAMAPAASRTVYDFLTDTKSAVQDYDMILTGDLGYTGTQLFYELMSREYGIDIRKNHKDCGTMIYDLKKQDVNSGGSGCGCSASVLCSHIMKNMNTGRLKKVMFVATGALMSPTTAKQGLSIPSIAHGVILEADNEKNQ